MWHILILEYYTTIKMHDLLSAIISGNLTSLKYKLVGGKKTPKDCRLDDTLFIKFQTKTIENVIMGICLFDKTIQACNKPRILRKCFILVAVWRERCDMGGIYRSCTGVSNLLCFQLESWQMCVYFIKMI